MFLDLITFSFSDPKALIRQAVEKRPAGVSVAIYALALLSMNCAGYLFTTNHSVVQFFGSSLFYVGLNLLEILFISAFFLLFAGFAGRTASPGAMFSLLCLANTPLLAAVPLGLLIRGLVPDPSQYWHLVSVILIIWVFVRQVRYLGLLFRSSTASSFFQLSFSYIMFYLFFFAIPLMLSIILMVMALG